MIGRLQKKNRIDGVSASEMNNSDLSQCKKNIVIIGSNNVKKKKKKMKN